MRSAACTETTSVCRSRTSGSACATCTTCSSTHSSVARVSRDRNVIPLLRLAVLPLVVIVAPLVAWKLGYFDLQRRQQLLGLVEHVRRWQWAESAYILAYAVTISLCVPAAVATLIVGAVFGAWTGAALAWVGSLAGTVLAHLLARYVARKPMRKLFGDHRLLRQLREHGDVMGLFRLRILPVASFAVLDYVAGVAGVSLGRLLLATMLGVVPSVVAYTYVGSEVIRGFISGGSATHRALWIAAIVTIA